MNSLTSGAALDWATGAKNLVLPHGWPLLARVMAEEVLDTATDEQSAGFFAAVGRRIAALAPVAQLDDLDGIVETINDVWAVFGFGQVAMEIDDEGIDIVHAHLPRPLDDSVDSRWSLATHALLEGAYGSWFHALGSKPNLRTWVRRHDGNTVELRHGL